jgi:hypothetical protein
LRLASARNDPSIHNDRLIEDGAETIADQVAVSRNPFVGSNSNNGPRGQSQRLRGHSLVWLSLGLRVRLSLSLGTWVRAGSLNLAKLIRLILLRGGRQSASADRQS